MALPRHDPDAPEFVRLGVNLADERLGARALAASDEFFAPKERMLAPTAPVFVPVSDRSSHVPAVGAVVVSVAPDAVVGSVAASNAVLV